MGPWSIPLLTARAPAQKVSRIGASRRLPCLFPAEREREREISGWGTCVRGLNARSACFPRKVRGPAGRHGRAPRSPARCRPCSFSRPQKEHARARPSSFPSQLHPPRTAAPSISIRILQHVRWIIARHCRWDLRIHGFGRSKVSRHRATPADLLGRRTLGGGARARQIWPIH